LKTRLVPETFSVTLFAVAFCAVFGYQLLLEIYAIFSEVHRVPDQVYSVQYRYSGIIFYLSNEQDFWLSMLSAIFSVSFVAGLLIELVCWCVGDRNKTP
jgi:hypothetical protein